MSAYLDLTKTLLEEGARGDLIALFFGFWFVALPIIGAAAVVTMVKGALDDRRDARARAMRRHPSARTTPDFSSEEARKYHESRQWGR